MPILYYLGFMERMRVVLRATIGKAGQRTQQTS